MKDAERGVTYVRKSTDKQEASIPEQMAWAEQVCARDQVRIAKSFEDSAISGDKITQRPGLQEMLQYCEAEAQAGRSVDCIVCWKQDRLSRATATHTYAILARLIDAGVKYLRTSERWIDLNDDTEQVIYGMTQAFNARGYVRSMSANVTRGMAGKAMLGQWPGGPPPYGYLIGPDGKLLPDPERAPYIRLAFELYEELGSVPRVAREFRRRQIPPPIRNGKEGEWSRSYLWKVLTNRVYTGCVVWGRKSAGKYHHAARSQPGGLAESVRRTEGRRKPWRNAEEDVFIVADAHEELVSPERFEAIAQRLRSGRKSGAALRRMRGWPLSRFLRCANCGGRMWGLSHKSLGQVYICSNYQSGVRCHCNYELADKLLHWLSQIVKAKLLELDRNQFEERLTKAMTQHCAQAIGNAAQQLEDVTHRLTELEVNINKATLRMALGQVPADMIPDVERIVRSWKV